MMTILMKGGNEATGIPPFDTLRYSWSGKKRR
jgi:hypothetical protein